MYRVQFLHLRLVLVFLSLGCSNSGEPKPKDSTTDLEKESDAREHQPSKNGDKKDIDYAKDVFSKPMLFVSQNGEFEAIFPEALDNRISTVEQRLKDNDGAQLYSEGEGGYGAVGSPNKKMTFQDLAAAGHDYAVALLKQQTGNVSVLKGIKQQGHAGVEKVETKNHLGKQYFFRSRAFEVKGGTFFVYCWGKSEELVNGKTATEFLDSFKIRARETVPGREISVLEEHTSSVTRIGFATSNRLASSSEKEIIYWDVEKKQKLHSFPTEGGYVAVSPNGKHLADRSGKEIRLWDAESGKEFPSLKGHHKNVSRINFSPDGRTLASASGDQTIKLWDVATGREKHTLKGHGDWVVEIGFHPDGSQLVSACFNENMKLWDTTTGKELKFLVAERGTSPVFSPGGKWLASGGDGIKLWHIRTGENRAAANVGRIWDLAFSPDGKWLACIVSARLGNQLILWNLGADAPYHLIFSGYYYHVAFNPNGKDLVLAGESGGKIRIWKLAD
jgi:WD40 repeat protein